MAGTVPVPLTTLSDGVRTFGPASVADTDSRAVLTLDRTVAGGLNSLTAATTIELAIEQSDDGGATWFLIVDGIVTGGLVPAFRGGGNAVTTTTSAYWAPGTGRQARAKMTVAGGPVAVQGTLTIS
jgi:hypothetical protein